MKYPAFVCISLCSLQLLVILLTSFPNWRTASADFVGRRSLCRPKAEGRFGDRRRRGGVLFLRNYPCLWHKDNFSFRAGVLEKVKQFTFSRYPSPPTRPNYDKITNTFGITDFVNAEGVGVEPTKGFLHPYGLANRFLTIRSTPPKTPNFSTSYPYFQDFFILSQPPSRLLFPRRILLKFWRLHPEWSRWW